MTKYLSLINCLNIKYKNKPETTKIKKVKICFDTKIPPYSVIERQVAIFLSKKN